MLVGPVLMPSEKPSVPGWLIVVQDSPARWYRSQVETVNDLAVSTTGALVTACCLRVGLHPPAQQLLHAELLMLAPGISQTNEFGSSAGDGPVGVIDTRGVAAATAEIAASPAAHVK